MPFTWTININKGPTGVVFSPNPLTKVATGDQIIWANNDTIPHWPGLVNEDGSIDKAFFMPNQIAANSTSPAFSPGVAAPLNYACSLHPTERGSIQVS
jgi:plastocyanin